MTAKSTNTPMATIIRIFFNDNAPFLWSLGLCVGVLVNPGSVAEELTYVTPEGVFDLR